jgi:hypothetical protein
MKVGAARKSKSNFEEVSIFVRSWLMNKDEDARKSKTVILW